MNTKGSWLFPFCFTISLVASAYLGFLLPNEAKQDAFYSLGFPFIFLAFFFWLLSSRPFHLLNLLNREFWMKHGPAAALAVLLAICAFCVSKPNYRVLADEANLAGVAASMYEKRAIFNPLQVIFLHALDGEPNYLGGAYDKRPIAYPFLVYVLHSTIGYSPNNPFILNGIVAALGFFLFYFLLQRWFSRFIGILGLLLLAAYPIIVWWITSRSFEIANITFALLAFTLLDLYMTTKNMWYMEFLGFTLVYLAQIRYESAIFPLCFFPVILYHLWKNGWEGIRIEVLLIPLLLLPIPWQRLTMIDQTLDFQMKKGEVAWGTHYLWPNFQSAIAYFSGADPVFGMIPGLAVVALVGLGYAIFLTVRNWSDLTSRFFSHVFLGGTVFLIHAAFLGFYYWGDLTNPVALRLGIIFIPFLVFFAVVLLNGISANGTRLREHLFLAVIAVMIFFWPIAGANKTFGMQNYVKEFTLLNPVFEERYPRRDALLVTNICNLYIPHRWSAVSQSYANLNPLLVLEWHDRKLFSDILFIQKVDFSTGNPMLASDSSDPMNASNNGNHQIDSYYRTEIVYETHFDASYTLRVSRLLGEEKGILPLLVKQLVQVSDIFSGKVRFLDESSSGIAFDWFLWTLAEFARTTPEKQSSLLKSSP